MMPTSRSSSITTSAPTPFSAIMRTASNTVSSGLTDHTSFPFRLSTWLTNVICTDSRE